MNDYWNKRYADREYAYGEDPNIFFAGQLNLFKPGTIILPCDGEGRNAVFAANNGWKVFAFDSSEVGKAKVQWLKPGERLILEAFNSAQLGNTSGGPKDLPFLYTENILKQDFEGLQIEFIQTLQTTLTEGKYHKGKADIVQFIGIKI